MQSIVLTSEELNALERMFVEGHAHACAIYIFGLRRKMDLSTKVCGLVSRVSYKMLDEIVECDPVRGSNRPKAKRSRRQIRYDLQVLEKSGLISPLIDGDGKTLPLVFFLAKAAAKVSSDEARHYQRTQAAKKTPTKSETSAPAKSHECIDDSHTSGYIQQQWEENLYLAAIDAYHAGLPNAPRVQFVGSNILKKSFGEIVMIDKNYQKPEFWNWYFKKMVPKNDFLMGRRCEKKRGAFSPNFPGLLNQKIIERVVNGAYF